MLIQVGIDSRQLTLSNVITGLGPFLGPEEDLTIVARGNFARNQRVSYTNSIALALLPAVLKNMREEPPSRQDGTFLPPIDFFH